MSTEHNGELGQYPDPDFQIGEHNVKNQEINFSPNGHAPTYHEQYLAQRAKTKSLDPVASIFTQGGYLNIEA